MLRDHHYDGKFFWPENVRTAVVLTLDFQGGEDVRPLPDGTLDNEEWTQCRIRAAYRHLAHSAHSQGREGQDHLQHLWRHRRTLIPEAVKAIVAQGHEIAGHGYHHECARELTREQEWDVMKRTGDMIQQPHRPSAARLALLHPEPEQHRALDGAWLSLEQQFLLI